VAARNAGRSRSTRVFKAWWQLLVGRGLTKAAPPSSLPERGSPGEAVVDSRGKADEAAFASAIAPFEYPLALVVIADKCNTRATRTEAEVTVP